MQERLHKFLARSGLASRRKCEGLIREGRVTVNGSVVTAAVMMVDPASDIVEVDGVRVVAPADHVYIALHKPAGVVTTVVDTHGRPTVMDLVPSGDRRLFPVGRLDMDSEGLLLLTDDGELAFSLTHPSRQVPKTYRVELARRVRPEHLRRIKRGIELEDGVTAPAEARVVDRTGRVVEITILEGRKRQVRRMFASLGNEVVRLTRIAFGGVRLGDLASGAWRDLTFDEVAQLRAAAAPKPTPKSRPKSRPKADRKAHAPVCAKGRWRKA